MDARTLAGRIVPGTAFVPHVHADPDALGAAFALARGFGGRVAIPGGVSAAGKRLADAVGLEATEGVAADAPLRVVVDASSFAQLRPFEARVAPFLLVDHHAPGDLAAAAEGALVLPRPSCAEVALEVLDAAARPPTGDAAFALVAGVVYDTARFRRGDAATFAAVARLLEAGGRPFEEAVAVVAGSEEDATTSGRIAALKAAGRAEVRSVGPWIVATSSVSNHEAQAAAGLVRCGADVAIVAGEEDGLVRVSGRASSRAAASLHLGELFRRVAREVGAQGGGHAGSAGLNGDVDAARTIERLVRSLEGP